MSGAAHGGRALIHFSMAEANEIITELPGEFIDEFEREILGRIPEEKVQVQLRQVQNAKIAQAVGSSFIPGIGQKIASIDPRLYFRLQHSFGHHENWLHDFLADNPELCAPGYKPRRKNDLRHSKSFIGGKPV